MTILVIFGLAARPKMTKMVIFGFFWSFLPNDKKWPFLTLRQDQKWSFLGRPILAPKWSRFGPNLGTRSTRGRPGWACDRSLRGRPDLLSRAQAHLRWFGPSLVGGRQGSPPHLGSSPPSGWFYPRLVGEPPHDRPSPPSVVWAAPRRLLP